LQKKPKLKDSKRESVYELYPIGQIPNQVIVNICKWMTYHFSLGKPDIDGEDWGDIFAKAIDGEHHSRPLGLADVVYENMAWSVKSIKGAKPFTKKHIRLISGGCAPNFSYNISDPYEDIQQTGSAVLSIWNERINVAKERYEPLRTSVLVRNFNTLEFALFENETQRYITKDFEWRINKKSNLEGYSRDTGKHLFTWQPHGAQFTILCDVPVSAKKFRIKRPPVLDFEETLSKIGFHPDWVTILED
jgi:hypothetical protein